MAEGPPVLEAQDEGREHPADELDAADGDPHVVIQVFVFADRECHYDAD